MKPAARPPTTTMNTGRTKKPLDWRKACVPKDLRRRRDELSGVLRSATVPNEVLQKRGAGKHALSDRHALGTLPAWNRCPAWSGARRLTDRKKDAKHA